MTGKTSEETEAVLQSGLGDSEVSEEPASRSLDALYRAEEWCQRSFEIAADLDGTRLRHLKRRHCVEWNCSWRNYWVHDWDLDHGRELQRVSAAKKKLDRVLPDLRDVDPAITRTLKKFRATLSNLAEALGNYKITKDHKPICRKWFDQKAQDHQMLQSGEAERVYCRGCNAWFCRPEDFETHFSKARHLFPCRVRFRDGDLLTDETYERHLDLHYSGDTESRLSIYIDTDSHVENVELASQKARKAYRAALVAISRDQMRELYSSGKQQEKSFVESRQREIRGWLDRYHAFAVDEGGRRREHVTKRRFCDPEYAIYGEPSVEWNDELEALWREGVKLGCELDRVVAIAEVVVPNVTHALVAAGEALQKLLHSIDQPYTEQEAIEKWDECWTDVENRTGNSIRRKPGEVARLCSVCGSQFSDDSDLVAHFVRLHRPPVPGSRIWMSPAEHLNAIEANSSACRDAYESAVTYLLEATPKSKRGKPRKPETRIKHARWHRDYVRIRSEEPGMTDKEISERIAAQPENKGVSSATILRVMKEN